jgi:hypothetical protein
MVSHEIIYQTLFDRMTFCTVQQYESVQRQYHKTMKNHGVYIEPFFWNANGELDYPLLVRVTEELIRNNSTDLLKDLDQHTDVLRHRSQSHFWQHPRTKTLDTYKLSKSFIEEALLPWLNRTVGDTCDLDVLEKIVLLPTLDFVAWAIVNSGNRQIQDQTTMTLLTTMRAMLPKMVEQRRNTP